MKLLSVTTFTSNNEFLAWQRASARDINTVELVLNANAETDRHLTYPWAGRFLMVVTYWIEDATAE